MHDTLVSNITDSRAGTWLAMCSVKNNYRGYLKTNFKQLYLTKTAQR